MATDDTGFSNQNIKEDTPSTPLTREALYALVWAEPMLKVAARYNVSSSYMARVCTLLNVPRPERGYWARLAVGKASPMPPLPEARPSDELVPSCINHYNVFVDVLNTLFPYSIRMEQHSGYILQ